MRESEELDEINFQERIRTTDDKKTRDFNNKTRTENVNKVDEKLRDRKAPTPTQTSTTTSDEEKAKQRDELRKKGACFYWKELGHIATACPKKTKN